VDELDEEADEAHDEEADAGGAGDLGELLPVGFRALLHEVHRILGELLEGFDEDLVEPLLLLLGRRRHNVFIDDAALRKTQTAPSR